MFPLIQRDYVRYVQRFNAPILAKIEKEKTNQSDAATKGDLYAETFAEMRISHLREKLIG